MKKGRNENRETSGETFTVVQVRDNGLETQVMTVEIGICGTYFIERKDVAY